MVGAPTIVSEVDPAAMITAIFIVQWLLGAVGDLSIHQWARGVKRLLPKETCACSPYTPNITPVDGAPWRVAGGEDCQVGCGLVAFSDQEMVCFAASCTPKCMKLLIFLYQRRHSKIIGDTGTETLKLPKLSPMFMLYIFLAGTGSISNASFPLHFWFHPSSADSTQEPTFDLLASSSLKSLHVLHQYIHRG